MALLVDGFAYEDTTLTCGINSMTEAKRSREPAIVVDSIFGALITSVFFLVVELQCRSQISHVLVNLGGCLCVFFIYCDNTRNNALCTRWITSFCERRWGLVQFFTSLQKWLFYHLLQVW